MNTSAGKTAWMLCQEFGGAEESGGRDWRRCAPAGRGGNLKKKKIEEKERTKRDCEKKQEAMCTRWQVKISNEKEK